MEILAHVFSCKVCNIFKIAFFTENLRITASDCAEDTHYDAYCGADDCEVDKL